MTISFQFGSRYQNKLAGAVEQRRKRSRHHFKEIKKAIMLYEVAKKVFNGMMKTKYVISSYYNVGLNIFYIH